jgi:SAM-dependent methyltransferase
MRIGVIPDGLHDRLVLSSRRFPLPLFDIMGTMMMSRAVMAGVHFGVFDRLAAGAKTASELATEAGCDSHAMRLLLDALAACGYLERERDGESFRNAPLGERWLRSDQPQTLAHFALFNYDQWDWVSHLEEFIQRGQPVDIHARLDAPHWRRYMLGLRDIAALSADEVARRLYLRAPRSLLDIGAGHCLYTIRLCERHPKLRATVVDLEPAARVGQELVAAAGLADRVTFRVGHLGETEFGESHDAAFLFNVMHHLDEDTNNATVRRVHAALKSGGKFVVWEAFREERERQRRDQMGALLGLFFGVASKRETLEFDQVAAWARQAGFRRIERKKLQTAPFAALLVATK